MKRRIISMILAASICLSMVLVAIPSASASFDYSSYVDSQKGVDFQSELLDFCSEKTGVSIPASGVRSWCQDQFFKHTGALSHPDDLLEEVEYYNSVVGSIIRFLCSNVLETSPSKACTSKAYRAYDEDNGIWRLADVATGKWIVDPNGRFPYVECVVAGGGSVMELPKDSVPDPEQNKAYKGVNDWIPTATALLNFKNISTYYSFDDLLAFAQSLNEIARSQKNNYTSYRVVVLSADWYGLQKIVSSGVDDYVYWLARISGSEYCPYVAKQVAYSSAANVINNYYVVDNKGNQTTTDKGDTIVSDNTLIKDGVLYMPITNNTYDNSTSIDEYIENLVKQYITNYTYNIDDHSYTVNTYDTTYNIDNRTYVTNNYTWNIKYNITNTYVTYIGSNDNYQKEYEFYYELPDGRSSADLTADEVAALSLQFADTINYTRAATDTNLRALYHFDGDTDDSGYFSTKTEFTWTTGASITYMDSGVFNGALYLDDSPHDFSITLPSYTKAGEDFTVQWRYYQASEPDTVNNIENYVCLGNTILAMWDERYLYNSNEVKLCYLPVGSWMEIAVMRHNGTIYIYCNGVKVGSVSNNAAFSTKNLRFHLGSTSRAYSMFDDLRVLDFAWRESGLSYVPTTVPHDSNLVLVLPGEEEIVDEWLECVSPDNIISNSDLTVDSWVSGSWDSPDLVYIRDSSYSPTDVFSMDGVLNVSSDVSSFYFNYANSPRGLFVQLMYGNSGTLSTVYNDGFSYADYSAETTYTFSVIDDSGTVYSLTFPFSYSGVQADFSWGSLRYCYAYSSSKSWQKRAAVMVVVNAGCSINLIYADLVRGETPGVTVTKHADVYDLSTLEPNTAAIQSSIPVTGYTVGGVRPTFPERGSVWFMVEFGRISSVQLYTGSAWESVTARWWTGERWIPIYAFDVYTLEDCYDIADTDDVTTPITSETGGWNWWKSQWKDFRSWLASNTGTGGSGSGNGGDGNAGGGSGGGSGSGGTYDYPSSYPTVPGDGEEGEDVTITDEDGNEVSIWDIPGMLTKAFRSVLKGAFSATAGGITGVFTIVKDGTFDFFNAFEDGLTVQSVDGYTEKYTVYDYLNIPEDELWD